MIINSMSLEVFPVLALQYSFQRSSKSSIHATAKRYIIWEITSLFSSDFSCEWMCVCTYRKDSKCNPNLGCDSISLQKSFYKYLLLVIWSFGNELIHSSGKFSSLKEQIILLTHTFISEYELSIQTWQMLFQETRWEAFCPQNGYNLELYPQKIHYKLK